MFSLENLFPIPYDEESPSKNKQMYRCVSSSKTKPSISEENKNALCFKKKISDRLEVTQGFIFKCHFYLEFFTVLPCFQQLQFGALILDFIAYFPQCALHQTDERNFIN